MGERRKRWTRRHGVPVSVARVLWRGAERWELAIGLSVGRRVLRTGRNRSNTMRRLIEHQVSGVELGDLG